MAKRRKKSQQKTSLLNFAGDNRAGLLKVFWAFVVIVSVLFGFSQTYPIIQAGQVGYGIMLGLLYSVGAFLAILAAFYINRKLRGM